MFEYEPEVAPNLTVLAFLLQSGELILRSDFPEANRFGLIWKSFTLDAPEVQVFKNLGTFDEYYEEQYKWGNVVRTFRKGDTIKIKL